MACIGVHIGHKLQPRASCKRLHGRVMRTVQRQEAMSVLFLLSFISCRVVDGEDPTRRERTTPTCARNGTSCRCNFLRVSILSRLISLLFRPHTLPSSHERHTEYIHIHVPHIPPILTYCPETLFIFSYSVVPSALSTCNSNTQPAVTSGAPTAEFARRPNRKRKGKDLQKKEQGIKKEKRIDLD